MESARLRLRNFTEADLENFARYRAQPAVARYQSWTTYTLADAQALYADMVAKPFGLAGEWYQIAIADRVTDCLLGDLALHFLGRMQIEVGFTLASENQRKGYGREAMGMMMGYVFSTLACRRAIAIVDARNRAAIQLLESCAFHRLAGERIAAFKGDTVAEFVFERLAD